MAADPTGMTPEAMRALVHNKRLEFRRGILSPSDYNGHYLDDTDAHDFARAILAISHDGLIEDFENWFDQHRAEFSNPRDQWDLIMETYFNQASDTHLSKTSKTNFTKFMADKFEATSTGTATKLQCQNCKQRFSKHFILPMYPQSLQLCDSNTYLFCWACLQAPGEQNYMVHPGPWLNNTTDAESANMEPTKNLNQIQNRPWALQSLDADFGKDFAPFVWTIAVRPDAHSAQEGVIQHSWNHQLNRWQRFPLSHVSEGNRITRYDLTEFQRLTSKVWKLKAANLAKHHHLITRASTYAQTLHQLRFENPYVEDSELRARTLKTLNFISNHAAASFFQIPAEQRQQILDTFIKWETNRIQAGLTGLDSSLHDAIHSDTNDLFLKQFWTVVLPSLHHHFICRNPDCKKVDPELPSGSDRVYAAVQAFDPQKTYDVIVNVQGDMPTLRPDDLKQVMAVLEEEDHVDIASLAAPQKDTKAYTSEHVVKVVLSVQQGAQRGRALYFTRAPVPWGGDVFYHHIGVYAYRRHILEKFCHLPPSPLEQCERLEQLRALEAGFRLDLAITDHIPEGVDSPDDLLKARKFFEISTSDHRASHFP